MRGMTGVRGLVAVALALLLGGCAVGEQHRDPAEVAASLSDAGDQAASAVTTVRTAVRLLGEDRITPAVADTTQADSIRVLEQATRTLTTLSPPDAATGQTRDELLAAVQDATTAVVAAGAWITGDPAARTEVPPQVLRDLDAAAGAVSQLAAAA